MLSRTSAVVRTLAPALRLTRTATSKPRASAAAKPTASTDKGKSSQKPKVATAKPAAAENPQVAEPEKPRAAAGEAPTGTGTKRYDTSRHENGFYGRSVPYSDVHSAKLQAFYDLTVEMQSKRCPLPTAPNK